MTVTVNISDILIRDLEKSVVLSMIDESWKDHLRNMDDLRQNVQGAVYEQKDPLLIYKHESFGLFKEMLDDYSCWRWLLQRWQ